MKKSTQRGFAHLGLLLMLLVVAIIAYAGYKVAKNHSSQKASTPTASVVAPQAIPTIKSTADLNTAESTLNSQNVDGDLNPSSLDQDVQSLL